MNNQLFCLLFFSLLLSGCAKSPLMVDRVLVKNASELTITEVKVRHEPTSKFAGVNSILPHNALDIGIPKQPMLARQAFIHWKDGRGQQRAVELKVPYDLAAAQAERAMCLIYILHPAGMASAHLEDSNWVVRRLL